MKITDPYIELAQHLSRIGFDLDEMESSVFGSEKGDVFKGNFVNIIPCNGLLRLHGDYLEFTFHVTHPIHQYAYLSGITANLFQNDMPTPVVSIRYELSHSPTRDQVIERIYQEATLRFIGKKFQTRKSDAKNDIKKAHKP